MPRILNYLPDPIQNHAYYATDEDIVGSELYLARSSNAVFNLLALFDPNLHSKYGEQPHLQRRTTNDAFLLAYSSMQTPGETGKTLQAALLTTKPSVMREMLKQGWFSSSPFMTPMMRAILLGKAADAAADLSNKHCHWELVYVKPTRAGAI